jgi:hypothetical protein
MKKFLKNPAWFLIVFPLIWLSCTKEPMSQVIELQINGNQKLITVDTNGIGIELYLLNEKGEPATVFNEGENFKFHLEIKNNVEKDTAMYIVSDFLRNPDLFRVYKSNGYAIGQPAEWYIMDLRTDVGNKIGYNKTWYMQIPWHETRGTEEPFDADNCIRVFQHYFIGLNQQPLSKGKYYTKFTQQFCLGRYLPHPQSEYVCTNTLILKINFEIK